MGTTAKMVQITGSYTQTSNEGYEEFLKKLNVGFILRKAAMASTPVMTIAEDGGNWTMITKTTVKSIELRFRLGEEFVSNHSSSSSSSSPSCSGAPSSSSGVPC